MSGGSRGVREERIRYWQSLIEEQERSGLSVSVFCQERSVSAASFYQWRTKMKRAESPTLPALLPVQLVNKSEPPQASGRTCVQVLTPSGLSLSVNSGNFEEDLLRLLRAIDMFEANRSC